MKSRKVAKKIIFVQECDKMAQKRITFRVSGVNEVKLEELSNRYGMSVNSLVGFIVGQWLDTHYDMKDRMLEKMTKEVASGPKLAELMGTDVFGSMLKEIVSEMIERELGNEKFG